MSRYRPVPDGDAAPAEAKLAATGLAAAKPAEAGHVSASNPAACFDPAEYLLRGAYSIDGMTAIAPAYFPEPGLLKRLCDAAAAGQHHASSEPGATRHDGDSPSDALETQNLDMSDAEVC
jgi:hypothetical protein